MLLPRWARYHEHFPQCLSGVDTNAPAGKACERSKVKVTGWGHESGSVCTSSSFALPSVEMCPASLSYLPGPRLVSAVAVGAVSNSPPTEGPPPKVCLPSLCKLRCRAELRVPQGCMGCVANASRAALNQWEASVRG